MPSAVRCDQWGLLHRAVVIAEYISSSAAVTGRTGSEKPGFRLLVS